MGQYFLDTQRQTRAAVFAGNSISVLSEERFGFDLMLNK